MDPFDSVLNALRSVGKIGAAVALRSGAFAIFSYILLGAADAIRPTLEVASIAAQRNSPSIHRFQYYPPSPLSPARLLGMRAFKDILI